MGIFGKKKPAIGSFIERAEMLGGSIQLELFRFCNEKLRAELDDDVLSDMAAAITNWVFHFGLITETHAGNGPLMNEFENSRRLVFAALGETFKTNATGVLILLGAAWKVEREKYLRHMEKLAAENFARVGKDTPNVSRELPAESIMYLYDVVSMQPPVSSRAI